jgi:hypothetical protein
MNQGDKVREKYSFKRAFKELRKRFRAEKHLTAAVYGAERKLCVRIPNQAQKKEIRILNMYQI